MAQIVYRGNLKTASFPFLSGLLGKSIIVKQQDQNAIRALAPGQLEGDEMGIPQIYYCHNVIPTSQGYKSVQYKSENGAQYPGAGFTDRVSIRDAAGNSAEVAVDTSGNLYVCLAGTHVWQAANTPPTPATIAGKFMTAAFVSGTSYIYFANVGCWTYTFATNTFNVQVLTSLVAADVLAVVSNRGYLIAITSIAVYWSSTTNAADFTPSLITGAGGGQVEGARGQIVAIGSVYGGFIVFTIKNAVAAIYSGNQRFPFNFIEVSGCGGVTNPNWISYDGNNPALYAYTTAGLQLVTLRDATNVSVDATDFLSGGLFEDFDESMLTMTLTQVSSTLWKKLVMLNNRYLLISYGTSGLTHVLFYDMILKQFGRLKVDHVDIFEWERSSVENPKNNIAFLGTDGQINTLGTDEMSAGSSGVMILGKFQYIRNRLLQLEKVRIDNVNSADTFNCYDLPTADGKMFGSALIGFLSIISSKFREYLFHNLAMNHSVVFVGAFHAISLELVFNVHGNR